VAQLTSFRELKHADTVFGYGFNGMKRCYFFIVLLLSLTLAVNVLLQDKAKETVQSPTRTLPAAMHELLDRYSDIGVSVAITSNGNTFFYQQGFRDREQSLPIDTQTQFQLASISKVFTAVGVLRLVESGKVMLDKPVNQYLSRWQIKSDEFDASQVTVRHLLDHTSGLSVDGYLGFMPNATLPTLEDSLNGELGSHSIWTQLYNRLIPTRQQVTLIQQSGSDWLYSGGGYTVLQLLIEEVSGTLFSTYMQEQLLSPLGLKHSTFQFENVDQQQLASGYSGFLSLSPNPNYRYTALAAAGLYSTIEDLIRFVSVFDASKATLMSKETRELMLLKHLGIFSYGEFAEQRVFGHNGNNMGGWHSAFRVVPQTGDAIALLSNDDRSEALIAELIELWQQSEASSH
tara:strand:- start:938 stop:2143 length:1206 start_codon:yes stop_codon:yes gene_type:complete